MEILSGADRRRNWSNELKEQIVSETLEPGVTVTEVARRHDVDRSLVYRWRRVFGVILLNHDLEAVDGLGCLPGSEHAATAVASAVAARRRRTSVLLDRPTRRL